METNEARTKRPRLTMPLQKNDLLLTNTGLPGHLVPASHFFSDKRLEIVTSNSPLLPAQLLYEAGELLTLHHLLESVLHLGVSLIREGAVSDQAKPGGGDELIQVMLTDLFQGRHIGEILRTLFRGHSQCSKVT